MRRKEGLGGDRGGGEREYVVVLHWLLFRQCNELHLRGIFFDGTEVHVINGVVEPPNSGPCHHLGAMDCRGGRAEVGGMALETRGE